MKKNKSKKSSSVNQNKLKNGLLELFKSMPESELLNSQNVMASIQDFFEEPEEDEKPEDPKQLLKQIKDQLKEMLIEDTEKVLLELKRIIKTDEEHYDDVILHIIRLKRFIKLNQKGLVPFQEAGLESRTISANILMLINTLKIEYLKDSFRDTTPSK